MSTIDHPLKAENEAFLTKAEESLRELFEKARATNELQFAFSLYPEFRGCQGEGWNTAIEARTAFDEYLEFINDGLLTPLKARVALAFYCHIAEASGFYEVPKNMLRVAEGGFHALWPFQDLVKVHSASGNLIAPNANRVLRDLAGHAADIGLHQLAEVFRDAFDGDIRNGYAHADYIVWDDGIRLRRRNGGNPKVVTWPEFHFRFNRAIQFFDLMWQIVEQYMQSYTVPKSIIGVYSDGRRAKCTIAYNPDRRSFSITD